MIEEPPRPANINHSTVMSIALVIAIMGAVFLGARAFGDSERRLSVIERDMAEDTVARAALSTAVNEQERRMIRYEAKIDSLIISMDEMRRALGGEPAKPR